MSDNEQMSAALLCVLMIGSMMHCTKCSSTDCLYNSSSSSSPLFVAMTSSLTTGSYSAVDSASTASASASADSPADADASVDEVAAAVAAAGAG